MIPAKSLSTALLEVPQSTPRYNQSAKPPTALQHVVNENSYLFRSSRMWNNSIDSTRVPEREITQSAQQSSRMRNNMICPTRVIECKITASTQQTRLSLQPQGVTKIAITAILVNNPNNWQLSTIMRIKILPCYVSYLSFLKIFETQNTSLISNLLGGVTTKIAKSC